jgi:hypothetical protein
MAVMDKMNAYIASKLKKTATPKKRTRKAKVKVEATVVAETQNDETVA